MDDAKQVVFKIAGYGVTKEMLMYGAAALGAYIIWHSYSTQVKRRKPKHTGKSAIGNDAAGKAFSSALKQSGFDMQAWQQGDG